MTGHLLGATGAMEAMFSIKSVMEDVVPPTINHEEGDDDENIDYNLNFTFNKAQKRESSSQQFVRFRRSQRYRYRKEIRRITTRATPALIFNARSYSGASPGFISRFFFLLIL